MLKIETLKIETEAKNRLIKAKADAEAIVIAADAAYQAELKKAEGMSDLSHSFSSFRFELSYSPFLFLSRCCNGD